MPNQIETLTMDFMSDLAVTNLNDALIYTANTENQDEYVKNTTGNQAYAPDQGGKVTPGGNWVAFIAACRAHDPKMANGNVDEAHNGSVLGHLMNNSYRLGKKVPFDAKAGRFGDNKVFVPAVAMDSAHTRRKRKLNSRTLTISSVRNRRRSALATILRSVFHSTVLAHVLV